MASHWPGRFCWPARIALTAVSHCLLPSPALPQVVGKKLSEAHHKTRLCLPDSMPSELKQLVWDCTHSDPQER